MADEHIEQIKDRLDIVEFISGYVKLTKAGVNFKGICPFHSEKTPSFMVNPEKRIWHCFGCSEGGDIFTFVEKIESMNFPEALKLLADRAGIDLPKRSFDAGSSERRDSSSSRKMRLLDALEAACAIFESQLHGQHGAGALDYARKRGLTDATIVRYRLGYAPEEWHALEDALKQQGFLREELLGAGLLVTNEQGRVYDRFRDRLMFPIFDIQGRVIGFGGRTLSREPDAGAKYLNTPQTEVYNKSRVLYGIHEAKLAIRKNDYVVLVEGYMDLIMSHQAGVRNVVAVSGTALTPEHLAILKRYTMNVMLSFDMDAAGERAAKRSVGMALHDGWNVKVVRLASGKDTADAVLEDPAIWVDALKNARPVVDYYLEVATTKYSPSEVMGKKRIAAEVFEILRDVQDPLELSHYLQKLSSLLTIPDTVLAEAFSRVAGARRGARGGMQSGMQSGLRGGGERRSSAFSVGADRRSSGADTSASGRSGGHERNERPSDAEGGAEPAKRVDRRANIEEECVGLLLSYPNETFASEFEHAYFRSDPWKGVVERIFPLFREHRWDLEVFLQSCDRSLRNACDIAMMKVEQLLAESGAEPSAECHRCYRELVMLSLKQDLQEAQLLLKRAEEQSDTEAFALHMRQLTALLEKIRSVS